MTIRIGITHCLDALERWRKGREYLYVDRLYAGAVEAAGAVPILLPIQSDVGALVDGVDGLLIPGGDDFLPGRAYPAGVRFDPAPRAQIDFDSRLLEAALARGRPVLGVCYGAQLLALCHGGGLHHHLPVDLPDASPHRLREADGRHACLPEPGSLLAGLLGGSQVEVNSLHHQAISASGDGLRVSGRAPDGVIEAIESEAAAFVLGVQWHPERLEGPAGPGLFRALVAACAAGQRS